MSNNQRIERMAAEKAAAERERKEKAEQRKTTPTKRATRSRSRATVALPGRMRVVWAVCNHLGDQVKTFPYPEKDQAEAEATRLFEQQNNHYYVEPRKIPMD